MGGTSPKTKQYPQIICGSFYQLRPGREKKSQSVDLDEALLKKKKKIQKTSKKRMGGERKEVKISIGLSLNGSTFQGETKVNKFAQQIKYDCKFLDILCLLDIIENLKRHFIQERPEQQCQRRSST